MRRIFAVALAGGLAFAFTSLAGEHAYTGVKKCSMCHKGEKHGLVYETWKESAHAKAFTVLGEENAAEVYAKLGRSGSPQEDPECLGCHVTGYGADTSLTAKLIPDNGVTCEACHGAGGDYWKKKVMQDKDAAVANGLVLSPKENCVTCHNEKSPTYKPFDFEEYWAKIKHGLPEPVEAETSE